jgi:hypothetical protein
LAILVAISSTVVNAWSATVDYGPTNAYQGTPFKFHVTITNNGSEPLCVNEINLTIYWPGWFFEDPEPTEHFYIFSGDQVIAPGDTRTFEKQITSDFFGGFSSEIKIMARSLNESSPSSQTIAMYMSFGSASEAPTDPIWIAFFLFLIFGGVALFVIYQLGPWGYDDKGMRLNQMDAKEVLASVPAMAKLYPDEVLQR